MSKFKKQMIYYINQDMSNMSLNELGKVYKFIRRSIIAQIPEAKCKCDGGICKVCRESFKSGKYGYNKPPKDLKAPKPSPTPPIPHRAKFV